MNVKIIQTHTKMYNVVVPTILSSLKETDL